MGVVLSSGIVCGSISSRTLGWVVIFHVAPEPIPILKPLPVKYASLADTDATLHGWMLQWYRNSPGLVNLNWMKIMIQWLLPIV